MVKPKLSSADKCAILESDLEIVRRVNPLSEMYSWTLRVRNTGIGFAKCAIRALNGFRK